MDPNKGLTAVTTDHLVLHPKYASLNALYLAFGNNGFRLDLGCGYVKPQGFIGLDNLSGELTQIPNQENAPDILIDLDRAPLPFPDNSCDEVRSSHFLEHSNLAHILVESYRVLRPGGVFLFAVPYANSAEGMYPGHHQFLTEKYFHENITFQKMFRIEREEYFPSDYWKALSAVVRWVIPFSFARIFLFNACCQMMIWCSPKK